MNKKVPMDSVIKCKTDKLGRVSIPVQYRRALGIETEDEVDMVFTGKGVLIFKETDEEILERKCNDIMCASYECKDMNVEDREKLGELLMKLIEECAE